MKGYTVDTQLKRNNNKSFTLMTLEEYFDLWYKNKLFREIYPLDDTI